MKAFEEWNRREHKDDLEMYGARPARDKERLKSWRAALEFVKSRIFEHEDALDVIEQELEGEK